MSSSETSAGISPLFLTALSFAISCATCLSRSSCALGSVAIGNSASGPFSVNCGTARVVSNGGSRHRHRHNHEQQQQRYM